MGRAIRGGARMAARAAGGARSGGNRGAVSFHFKMGQTGSVGAAVAHQSYSDCDGAFVARSATSTRRTKSAAHCGALWAIARCRGGVAYASPQTQTMS